MLNIFTRKFISEINDFLTNNEWPDSWNILTNKEYYNFEELIQVFKEDRKDFNEILILNLFALLPKLDKNISRYRNREGNYLLKYSDYAELFDSFRIAKFNIDSLNDKHETGWLDKFDDPEEITKKYRESFIKLSQEYNVLMTYTTTTLQNHKYMISNYSRSKKTARAFNKYEVFNGYDNLFSNKIKPFRGYIRYNKYGKKEMLQYIKSIPSKYKTIKWILSGILTAFVKGCCMAPEGEYRFFILTTSNFQVVDLTCIKNSICKFHCSVGSELPFYKDEDSTCECNFDNTNECNKSNCMELPVL